MIEPVNLGVLKPLGEILEDRGNGIVKGLYYYFPFFQDTRIYI